MASCASRRDDVYLLARAPGRGFPASDTAEVISPPSGPRTFNSNERSNEGIENAMTKRPHDSVSASPYVVPPGRQASHDADGNGSHEDGEGSSLKKPRSFMATLVCRIPPK